MDELLVDAQEGVIRITINRPSRSNALTPDLIGYMTEAISAASTDASCRAVVITGTGEKAFCAGADLKEGTSFSFDYSQPDQAYAKMLRAAHCSKIPLIARVNGACMAGGMGLLAMCDMAVAVDDSVFGLPEVKVGLFPLQVLSALQGILPSRSLYELCLTGEPMPASEALQLRLVNYLVPRVELDTKVDWLLARIVDKSPSAIRRGRYVMKRIESLSFEESVSFTESQIGLVAMTRDAHEGQTAFIEKRKPQWTGK